MKGFVVYPTYRIKDDKSYVHLFGRLENGETFLTISEFKPYFFIKKSDLKKAKKISENYETEETKLKNFDDEEVVKIILDTPKRVPMLRDLWHENEIPSYEADILFVYRFLIDNEIRGSLEIKGKSQDGKEHGVDKLFIDPKLTPTEWKPNLKVLSFDIETDKIDLEKYKQKEDLFCISLYTDDYKRVLLRKKGKLKDTENFEDEESLLKRFQELVKEIDPDIITGWNVIDFDLAYLEKKFKQHKIPFELGRTKDKCSMRKFESFFQDSSADFPGRQVLDGIHLMRISFVRLDDYKLDTAAHKFLGEKKVISTTGKAKYIEIKEAYEKDTAKLVKYNLKDSILAYDILQKSGVLDLTIQRSLIAGMQLDRVRGSVASLDSLYLVEIRKRGYVAPSRGFGSRDRRITGGYVMESKPGIYDYVIVCDFKSLYPSIMRTFNIDPWAYVPEDKEKNYKKKDLIEAPNGAKFKREKGVIPDLLQMLWERRNKAKKENNKLESNAVKVLMNSIFGVLANPSCRFYSFQMSNAITHFGQHWIKETAKILEKKGFDVIYSDTDSIFIDLKVDNEKEAKKIAESIVSEINTFFTKHIKDKYKVDSYLELEFEKVYKRFLMPKVRDSEEGAKKRYAGLIIKDGKEKMDFIGMEFVRRDWTELAKQFQLGMVERIFKKEDPTDFVKKFVDDLKKGKHDDLLVYRKALRKDVKEYTKTTPPHVKAARKMEEITSKVIEYVMTSDGPEPVGKISHEIDYDHYVDKQLEPIANQVLTFYGANFDDVLKGTKQVTLDGF